MMWGSLVCLSFQECVRQCQRLPRLSVCAEQKTLHLLTSMPAVCLMLVNTARSHAEQKMQLDLHASCFCILHIARQPSCFSKDQTPATKLCTNGSVQTLLTATTATLACACHAAFLVFHYIATTLQVLSRIGRLISLQGGEYLIQRIQH